MVLICCRVAPAAVVAGAATGAAVAHDRRTMGSIVDDEAVEVKAAAAILPPTIN